MEDVIIIHYSEICLKGKNRGYFERKLIQNLKRALRTEIDNVKRDDGRIICQLSKKAELERIRERLMLLPGISYFSFAKETELDIDKIKKKVISMLKKGDFNTFAVRSMRSNKNFPISSQQINEIIGKYIAEKLRRRVDLKDPDITVYVEICKKGAFIYLEKYRGIGGLPVGSSGKIVASLSGGIDSPVASFLMMKRGCEVVFVHIFNRSIDGRAVITKIYDVVEQLTRIQLESKIYIVPFEDIQKRIISSIPARYRMIIYRRSIMKILNEIAKIEKALGIVTGDNLGQVASQTLDNLRCIYDVSDLPVFTPLIGMNKEETVELARKIGTYEISIRPYPDCCSFMIARHPETRAKIEDMVDMEKTIENLEELIKEAIEKSEIKRFEIESVQQKT